MYLISHFVRFILCSFFLAKAFLENERGKKEYKLTETAKEDKIILANY
jgi:hypothetical protein